MEPGGPGRPCAGPGPPTPVTRTPGRPGQERDTVAVSGLGAPASRLEEPAAAEHRRRLVRLRAGQPAQRCRASWGGGHSPSGATFFGGADGGCRGPWVSTPPPGRSRGRKRFLQEGARRNTFSSPCMGDTAEMPLSYLPGTGQSWLILAVPLLSLRKEGSKHLALCFAIWKMNWVALGTTP